MTPDGQWLHGMGIEPYPIRETVAVPTDPAPAPTRISAEICDGDVVKGISDFNNMLSTNSRLAMDAITLERQNYDLKMIALDNARIAKMWRAMFFIASGVLAAKVALDVAR